MGEKIDEFVTFLSDKILDIEANATSCIRLIFAELKQSLPIDRVHLFLIDENGNCEECFSFNLRAET